jgi:hypothetical protein
MPTDAAGVAFSKEADPSIKHKPAALTATQLAEEEARRWVTSAACALPTHDV